MEVTKTSKLDYNVRRGQMPTIGRSERVKDGTEYDKETLVQLDTYHALQAGDLVEVDTELAKWLFERDMAEPVDTEAKALHESLKSQSEEPQ